MLSYLKYFIIICSFLIGIAYCNTNDINYKDFHSKEIVHDKIEGLYFLNIKENKNIKIILTGRNIIDYDNFNAINRMKTCTTIRIDF
jgi:hypothetical protein